LRSSTSNAAAEERRGKMGDLVVAIYWLSWTYIDTVAARTRKLGSKV
jgi:hypothetical protein